MNIIEALKTGRPMKRQMWPDWRDYSGYVSRFDRDDLLADDWEVQPEIVEISREEYFKAVAAWAKADYTDKCMWARQEQYVDYILNGAGKLWEELQKQGKAK